MAQRWFYAAEKQLPSVRATTGGFCRICRRIQHFSPFLNDSELSINLHEYPYSVSWAMTYPRVSKHYFDDIAWWMWSDKKVHLMMHVVTTGYYFIWIMWLCSVYNSVESVFVLEAEVCFPIWQKQSLKVRAAEQRVLHIFWTYGG